MLSKLDANSNDREPPTAERLADLFFEIGKDQADKSHPAEALKWLVKAYNAISTRDEDELSSDAPELIFRIMHTMVRAHIKLKQEDDIIRAWNLVQDMHNKYGNKLAVLLLKLDLYALDPIFPPQEYTDVLLNIVQTVHLTETNIKTALHHIHKLRVRNSRMAHTVLVSLLMERLLGAENSGWLEKTLITIVWNFTTSSDLADEFDRLRDVLDGLHAEIGKAIGPSATHAAQVVSLSS